MSLDTFKSTLGNYAKDTMLNLGIVMGVEGAPDLTHIQINGIALASAYATRQPEVIEAIFAEASPVLSLQEITAAKAAASIMAMNNVYYRFAHLVSDKEYAKMPAKLRMNVIGSPGIPKVDFELYSLAVSAINGCGMCMDAHVHEVEKAGITKTGVQSAIRIASVICSAAQGAVLAQAEKHEKRNAAA